MRPRSGLSTLKLVEDMTTLYSTGTVVGLTDRELLERFLHQIQDARDDAFRALVERHGSMVLRICNQVLRDSHAAEDAFQATFLVLAQRARSIRNHDSVASWLFGVASRNAARIRMMTARRLRQEQDVIAGRHVELMDANGSTAQWIDLHEGIAALPEKYRLPIILCYFEGLTHEQAAARLAWPLGTVKTRLARGRERIRHYIQGRHRRFARSISPALIDGTRGLPVSPPLVDATLRQAGGFVVGHGSHQPISSSVLVSVQQELKIMFITKLKLVGIAMTAATATGLSALALVRQSPAVAAAFGNQEAASPRVPDTRATTVLNFQGLINFDPTTIVRTHAPFVCRVDNISVSAGSSVKKNDPLVEVFSTELGEAKSNYEAAISQWTRDKKVLDFKALLARENTLARKELIEAENDEVQSRLKMKLAKDKLLAYGLSEAEIDHSKDESGTQKMRWVLRARGDGIVSQRDVVVGNIYEPSDTLLTMATRERLRVSVRIDPGDARRINVGDSATISRSSSDQIVTTTIEAIDWNTFNETGKVGLRTAVFNSGGHWKAGMIVRLGVASQSSVPANAATGSRGHGAPLRELEERLQRVEQKLNQNLDARDSRINNEGISARLSEIERKLDRLLNARSDH